MDWKSFWGEGKIRRWLLAILILAIVLRVFFLWDRSIWFDEAASLFVAQKGYLTILTALGQMDFNPPLYFLLLHTWMLPTASLLWVELFSVLAGALAVLAMYRWGKVLYNERVGLFAAFLFAIACLQVRYAQEIRMYSLAVLFTVASNYYFAKVTREERFREGYMTWMKYMIVTVLALYIHYYTALNLLVQNLYLFWRYRDRKLLKLWVVAQGAIAVLFLPWVPMLIEQIRNFQSNFWIARPTFSTLIGGFLYLGDNLFAFAILAILAIGGVVSLYRIRERKIIWRSEKRNVFLLCLLIIPILSAFVLSLITHSIFYERYFIIFAPALYILAAKGLSHLSNRIIKWTFLIAVTGAMLLCLVPFYRSANTDIGDAARYLTQHQRPGDLVVHVTPSTFLPFQIYHGMRSEEYVLSSKKLPIYLGGNYYDERIYLNSIFDIVGKDAKRAVFVDIDGLNDKVQRALQGIAVQDSQGHFGRVWITIYNVTLTKEALIQYLNATIGQQGFKLEKADQPKGLLALPSVGLGDKK